MTSRTLKKILGGLILVAILLIAVLLFWYRFSVLAFFSLSEAHGVIIEYCKIFFSWPVIVLVLGLIFVFKFSSSIGKFLENVRAFKVGPFEATAQGLNIVKDELGEKLKEDGEILSKEQRKIIEDQLASLSMLTEEQAKKLAEKEGFVRYLVTRSEFFEFAFLFLYLVPNTKRALRWFSGVGGVTNEFFVINFRLLTYIPDPYPEKQAILNALLSAQLIKSEGGQYKITNKGVRFLVFLDRK